MNSHLRSELLRSSLFKQELLHCVRCELFHLRLKLSSGVSNAFVKANAPSVGTLIGAV